MFEVHNHDLDPTCKESVVFGQRMGECLMLPEEKSKKSDPVNHPTHYTQYPVEVIEITERLGFLLGNVVKYVLRADYKGEPIQDLEKAAWYLNREINNRKAAQSE